MNMKMGSLHRVGGAVITYNNKGGKKTKLEAKNKKCQHLDLGAKNKKK